MDALLAKPVERLSPFFTAKAILHSIDIEEHLDRPACEALRSMAKFVSVRLAKGDRELGRSGAICPFAKQGSQTAGIRFSHCDVELGEVAKLNGVMDERDLLLKRQELIADERESLACPDRPADPASKSFVTRMVEVVSRPGPRGRVTARSA